MNLFATSRDSTTNLWAAVLDCVDCLLSNSEHVLRGDFLSPIVCVCVYVSLEVGQELDHGTS